MTCVGIFGDISHVDQLSNYSLWKKRRVDCQVMWGILAFVLKKFNYRLASY